MVLLRFCSNSQSAITSGVAVAVGLGLKVAVIVRVGVAVRVSVLDMVYDEVCDRDGDAVIVGVRVTAGETVQVRVALIDFVGVTVRDGVNVRVAVLVGVSVRVIVSVRVVVGVRVGV